MRISEISNPAQTILVTTRYQYKDNIIALNWHMPLSFEPMMYAISIGKNRHSLELIKKSKIFIVHFMDIKYKKQLLFCGRNSGHDTNKFEKSGFTKELADTVGCSRIKEAAAFLECQVTSEIETGDHVLFIGKVSKAEINDKDAKRIFNIKGDKFTNLKKV